MDKEFRNELSELYHNFEYFCSEWYLEKYKLYNDNINEQIKLHSNSKIIIQSLFGFSDFYLSRNPNYPWSTIIESIFKNNIINQNINFKIGQHSTYFNLMPSNENECIELYNILKQGYSDDNMRFFLKYPRYDQTFNINQKKIIF